MSAKIFLIFCVMGITLCASQYKETGEKDGKVLNFGTKLMRNKTEEEFLMEETKDYWNHIAMEAVSNRLNRRLNYNTAKNVILFLGDGMSVPTVSATRVYLGGEEMSLPFDLFPYTGLSKTYCVDYQTPDSACSATAYLGGVKANLGTIGVTAAVKSKNCTAMNVKENRVDSIARLFQLKGKKTGLVTTTTVTHASPAGVYAHTAYRHWESDSDVLKFGGSIPECEDIAHQLVFGTTGSNLNVILGGGRSKFLPNTSIDEDGYNGARIDGVNLIEELSNIRKIRDEKFEYVRNRDQLLSVRNDTEYLLGLFQPEHMSYNKDRNADLEPSLEEMTEAALKILNRKNSPGFFLFVEGGKIDMAHHFNRANKALDETAEFAKAVQKALELTDDRETLIIVTADHAHTMSYAGYAARGSDVFGYAGMGSDDNPYTILTYANGPGYKASTAEGSRYVPSFEEMNDINYQWPATMPIESETHGADDVAIYATGPWAHLFTGVMEQNVIPHLIGLAACVSAEINCDEARSKLA